jgi:hypothetical protein
MLFKRRRRPPEGQGGGPDNPPKRVRVEVNDVTYLLDDTLSYFGIRGDGMHVWNVVGPAHERFTDPPTVTIGELPGRTYLNMLILATPDGMMRFGNPGDY